MIDFYVDFCLKALKNNKSDKKDALRWRYTQQDGYFYIDGETDYAVGVSPQIPPQTHWKDPINKYTHIINCIEGRGKTLQAAIDSALRKMKKGTLKRSEVKGITWPKKVRGI